MSATVLVVDDEVHIRRIVSLKLRQRGHEVAEARDGRHALELLHGGLEPQCVVLDIMMPKLDGISLLEQLRAEPRWASLPVIVLSAVREDEERQRLEGLGIADYVHKPFDSRALCDRIDELLSRPDSPGRCDGES